MDYLVTVVGRQRRLPNKVNCCLHYYSICTPIRECICPTTYRRSTRV